MLLGILVVMMEQSVKQELQKLCLEYSILLKEVESIEKQISLLFRVTGMTPQEANQLIGFEFFNSQIQNKAR